jgi:hypothetical protein
MASRKVECGRVRPWRDVGMVSVTARRVQTSRAPWEVVAGYSVSVLLYRGGYFDTVLSDEDAVAIHHCTSDVLRRTVTWDHMRTCDDCREYGM